MPKGRIAVVVDDDDDHPSSISRAPRPPPLPSVDSAESSDIHNDSYLDYYDDDDDDDDDDDYGYGYGNDDNRHGRHYREEDEEEDEEEIIRSYDDGSSGGHDGVASANPGNVILVGSNRKSAYPATPSDHDHARHAPGCHPPHRHPVLPQGQYPVDIRRTPGPPCHRHPCHHGPHPQGPSHRLTPGAGAAKFKTDPRGAAPPLPPPPPSTHTPFRTPSSKQFRNNLPELIDEDHRGPAVAVSTPAPRDPPSSSSTSPGTFATTPQISNRAVDAIVSATANVAEDEEPPPPIRPTNRGARRLPVPAAISTADDDAPLPSPSSADADADPPPAAAAAAVETLLQSRDRHRQKHLYMPAHITLSKKPHLNLERMLSLSSPSIEGERASLWSRRHNGTTKKHTTISK